MARTSLLVCVALVLGAACAQGGFGDDAGRPSADGGRDAGRDGGEVIRDAGRDGGARLDAGRDAGPPDAGPPDAGRDAGPDAGPLPPCPPSPSTLAIVEVMMASQTGSTDRGEWFEVLNLGACPIELVGLVIEATSASGPRTHGVTAGRVEPGGHFVFAQSGDAATNHGLPHDYVYGSGTTGVIFENGGGTLTLSHGRTEIDRVTWGSTEVRVGAARQLSSAASPLSNADLSSSAWCDATDVYSAAAGGPYRGTPRAANRTCP